jgi:predicted kinase
MNEIPKIKLQQVSQDYLERTKQQLPGKKASRPFVIGIIGLISSGKTTVAKLLNEKLTGTVLVKSDSARFLLKEAGLKWGENVVEVLSNTARWLLRNGYSIIFDGDCIREEKRKEIQKLVDELDAKFYIIRIKPNKDLSLKHLQKKWEDLKRGKIPQNFSHFLAVMPGEKQSLFDRVPFHEQLKSSDVPQLIYEIDNSVSLKFLKKQINSASVLIKAEIKKGK